MQINLSWDLFVIVFFAVIIAYSFIIGRNQTLKIIISSYIAILAADGIGNLIQQFFIGENAIVEPISVTNTESSLIIIKIVIFVFTIVLMTTRGRFDISMGRTGSGMLNFGLALIYGILSAGLITSTILLYASGTSLMQEGLVMNDAMINIYRESQLVRLMINNYNVWFALPAITFVVSSLIGGESEA
ncbi:MAG: hypothetical protein V1908_01320 [Candidatus Peregrinibacteria bacterium]